ncbi:ClpP/crotonase-like domain-containing protein [Mycena amicta]|nr:ClpP/crotonase-like domain-containing protein [Mycena amicta]
MYIPRRSVILALLSTLASALRFPSYGTLRTTQSNGVLNVVINNTYSTINLFDKHVQADLGNLIEELQADNSDVRVVVFSSGNEEFFIGHIDVEYFLPGYESPLPLYDYAYPDMLFPVALLWNITQLPQATIAIIEGRTRGIGNEFLMSLDMRFASTAPSVLLNQFETSFGVNPGAGGAMYLTHNIGRARTLEYVLSAADVDGRTAAALGWVNKAFDSRVELHEYVCSLARRIALWSIDGIRATKVGINAASRPQREVLVRDAQNVISGLIGTKEVQDYFKAFVSATRNQEVSPLELDYGREVVGFVEGLRRS